MVERAMNIESRLKELCIENIEYAELWSTWNLNKQTLDPILNTIIKDYPHYSFHDSSHSESILLNIERILGDNIKKLSPTDLWLILHASYLHDFGMVILDTKVYEIWGSKDFQYFVKEQCDSADEDVKKAANLIIADDKITKEYDLTWPLEVKKATTVLMSAYCRGQHAELSQEYILDTKNIWGIDLGHNGLVKNRLISLISDISVMHTKQFESVLTLHKESNGFKNDYTHPRFVAALLRLGDVLDLDNGRFNVCGNKIFGELPITSKRHFEKHESTKHVLITKEIIEVEADCKSDEVYRETRRWFDLLKQEVEDLNLSWNDIAPAEFGRPPKLAMCKITRNGSDDLNELANLRFKISQSKAFEIIEGSSIYKDRFACLREVIQNAEDASKIQLWRDIKSGIFYCDGGINRDKVESGELLPNDIPSWIYEIYSIEVNVCSNENNNAVVTIKDHGTGISVESLKAICNVGQSYFAKKETKQEVEEMPIWLRPTANFGIGLQSCFLVANNFTIITKSNVDGALAILFESGKESGFVSVKSISGYETRGSTLEIEFKNNMSFSYRVSGFTAKKLSNVDPLESNCVVMYKVIESILNECGSSFFNIKIISTEINYNETIKAHGISENQKIQYLSRNEFLYRMTENNHWLEVWYKNNLYKIRFIHPHSHESNVLFKGKKVTRYYGYRKYMGMDITIDIYGLETKKALSLNRESLTQFASREIREDLKQVIQLYFDLLLENKDDIKSDKSLVNSCFISSWIYGKKFPSDLKEYVSTEKSVRVLKYNEEKNEYEYKKISLHDILDEYPQLSYFGCRIENSVVDDSHLFTVDQVLSILNNSDIDSNKYHYIVIDEMLKEYLENSFCNYTFIDEKKELHINTVILADDLPVPDAYTKKCFIKDLTTRCEDRLRFDSRYALRRAIPAFKEYEDIASNIQKLHYIGYSLAAKWHIISPILYTDVKKINEMSKEAFIAYITEREVFDKLVNYVLGNAKNKAVTKDRIIECYKMLIAEYYDTVKDDDIKEE